MPMHDSRFDDPPYTKYSITLKPEYEGHYPEEGWSLLPVEDSPARLIWFAYSPRDALLEFLSFVDDCPELVFGIPEDKWSAKAQAREWSRRNTRYKHFNVVPMHEED